MLTLRPQRHNFAKRYNFTLQSPHCLPSHVGVALEAPEQINLIEHRVHGSSVPAVELDLLDGAYVPVL